MFDLRYPLVNRPVMALQGHVNAYRSDLVRFATVIDPRRKLTGSCAILAAYTHTLPRLPLCSRSRQSHPSLVPSHRRPLRSSGVGIHADITFPRRPCSQSFLYYLLRTCYRAFGCPGRRIEGHIPVRCGGARDTPIHSRREVF